MVLEVSTPGVASRGEPSPNVGGDIDPLAPLEPQAGPGSAVQRDRVSWTADMVTVLVRTLVQQLRLGKRASGSFKEVTWNAVSKIVGEHASTGGQTLEAKHCQSKYNNLKRIYEVWKRLRGLSGWGWDPVALIPLAPDSAWENEIARNALARRLRKDSLANAEELKELFDGVTASGNYAIYSSPAMTMSGMRVQGVDEDSDIEGDNPAGMASSLATPTPGVPRRSTNMRVRERPQSSQNLIATAISKLADSELTSSERAMAKYVEYNSGTGDDWTMEDKLDIYELFEDERKACIYLGIVCEEEQKAWLTRQLRKLRTHNA